MRLLDLYCGAGGAGTGYHRAGFEVVGVDNRPQPHYPFAFVQADALEYCAAHGREFDVIHASPPCQRYTSMCLATGTNGRHPDLIAPTRDALVATEKPFIIENVRRSPLNAVIMLCGAMFDLRVYRHRLFESNILLLQPAHPRHVVPVAKASRIPRNGEFWSAVGCFGNKDDAQRAMGIDWMQITGARDREIAEAIPPAYTEWIGKQLISALESVHA